jgi:hypothetical protein
MVMVRLKTIAQLDAIFPSGLDALGDAKFLEERNRAVDSRPVDIRAAALRQFMHRLRLMTEQGIEDVLTLAGQALAGCMKGLLQLR